MTFGALGQVLHLLEDMAVPAHTRNDFVGHLRLFIDGFYNPYERYVKLKNASLMSNITPQTPSFISPSLTDFWDTTGFENNNFPLTGLSIGLAEFTNANYFSDSTIPTDNPSSSHQFDHPSIDNINYHICEDFAPGSTIWKRKYVGRNGDPDCDHFAAVSPFNPKAYDPNYLNANISTLKLSLDDNVHNTYAKELLPRAVGYSAGLLDYFFRGNIEITPPDQVAYAVTDGSQTPYVDTVTGKLHQQFTSIKAKIRNSTPDTLPAEEVQGCNLIQGNCTLQAVAKYKIIPNYDPYLENYPPDGNTMLNTPFSYSVSAPIEIDSLSSETPQQFDFDFVANPIPVGITDLYLQVVFKGTLGNETDIAVAVGMKDLMEPTHQVFWNLTDMFDLKYNDVYHLYTADEIRADPELLAATNGEYINPIDMTFAISYVNELPPHFGLYTPAIDVPPGRHIRLIALFDNPQGSYLVLKETDSLFGTSYFYGASPGVVNQENEGVWQMLSPITTFRYWLDVDGVTQIPIRQHYDIGLFNCYPREGYDIYGNPVCMYPDEESELPI